MRIALVIPEFDPAKGGAENWTFQFAGRLLQHGHDVHVVARRFSRDAEMLPIVEHPVSVPPARFRKDYLAFAAAAERELKTFHADVVHDMGHGWYADLFQPHGGTRFGSFHQNLRMAPAALRGPKTALAKALPRYRALFELERRQFEETSSNQRASLPRFIALSHMVRRDIMTYHPALAEGQVRVVHNGVDTDRFSPERCEPVRCSARDFLGVGNEAVFLLLAHNFRLKGVATAIHAVARLARFGDPGILVVAGRDRPGPYRRLAHRLGCADRVRFISEAADPVPLYAAADVYVQPTFYDPCSLVVLEALACGLPVVTTACNGASELLTHGRNGFVVEDPEDHGTLAGHFQQLLDADYRLGLGRAARQTAEAHTLEHNYREILSLYRELAPAKVQRVHLPHSKKLQSDRASRVAGRTSTASREP